MKKIILFAAVLSVFSLSSCKKDTCTIDGEKTTCEEYYYGTSCNKVYLEAFQAACKAYGGKLSTK